MKNGKAYFAHNKRKYNTPEEAEELIFIQKLFKGDVICPNLNLGDLGKIERYLEVIQTVDCIYASEYQGYIGRGVFEECTFALENNINVFVVRKDQNKKFFVQEVTEVIETNSFNFVRFGCLITK